MNLNITHSKPLPAPLSLIQELSPTPAQRHFVEETRCVIQKILEGTDPRFLVIMGPCSIHDMTAAKEYAAKLKQLSDSVADTFYIVMRVYFEKSRTSLGWKGFLYDPWLDGSNDIHSGIKMTRELLLDLAEMRIPTAAEFLDLSSAYYFGDLISWGCIGARTASSQIHRQMASLLPMPVAFKNSTDGNIDVAINGVLNASLPHSFIGINEQGIVSTIQTTGNKYGHIVLRGGEKKPNYDPQSICQAIEKLKIANLPPSILVDCSHDNSMRKQEQQIPAFKSIINQVIEGNHNIRGALIESHLNGGNQPLIDPAQLKYGTSLTDPCLNWSMSEQLIHWGYSKLTRERILEHLPSTSSFLLPKKSAKKVARV